MKIVSAKFVKGVGGTDSTLENGIPQVAFIGRSNVGKSSIIDSLTGKKGLVKTSARPGHTQEINLFLINDSVYLVDLPGYGFAEGSRKRQEHLQKLIGWYLFESPYEQRKIVMIIDGNIGATKNDLEMLQALQEHGKRIVIVANKIDKIKKSEYTEKVRELENSFGNYKVIPYSSKEKIGINELTDEVLEKSKEA